jgi:hypothetical protein
MQQVEFSLEVFHWEWLLGNEYGIGKTPGKSASAIVALHTSSCVDRVFSFSPGMRIA